MAVYRLGDSAPSIESGAWVADSAQVIGDVVLEESSSVWFGAVLRGDNELISIGENSNVQDGAVMHTDPGLELSVGRNCTIGHKAILHGCTIGDNTLIGMGAVILNRAKIGANCLIGANTLITEGKVIPENSLVMGQPGKIAGELNDEAIARLSKSAETYVNNWQRYAKGLTRL